MASDQGLHCLQIVHAFLWCLFLAWEDRRIRFSAHPFIRQSINSCVNPTIDPYVKFISQDYEGNSDDT